MYLGYYKNNSNMYDLTLNQISKYEKFAKKTKVHQSNIHDVLILPLNIIDNENGPIYI